MPAQPVPFSIAVGPYRTVAAHGQRALTVHATVADSGTKPISVHTSMEELRDGTHGCGLSAIPWAKASPAAFKLEPNQKQHVTVNITAPATVTGHVDLAAVFTGKVKQAQQHGPVTITGAVGSRIELSLPGPTTAKPCPVRPVTHHHVTAAPPSGGGSMVPLALAIILAAIILATGWVFGRRRRRGGGEA